MKKEKSCGCIIIDNNEVLLIKEKYGKFWGFPKGHIEENETEIETALREVLEEVGLNVIIDEKKRYEIHYITSNNIDKTSVYYLAKPLNKKVIIQESEIADYRWLNIDEAINLLTYDDCKELLKKIST